MKQREKQLWDVYMQSRSDADRNALVMHYDGLCGNIAQHYVRLSPRHADEDDIKQAGTMGLMDAIPRFDPSRDLQPATFLSLRIRGAILDYQRDIDPVPRLTRGREKVWAKAVRALEHKLNRPPSEEEIREHLNLSDREYQKMRTCATSIPQFQSISRVLFDPGTPNGRSMDVADTLIDEHAVDPSEHATRADLCQYLISVLPPRFAMVVTHYFMSGETLNEIGRRINMSESRMSQLLTEAKKMMHRDARLRGAA